MITNENFSEEFKRAILQDPSAIGGRSIFDIGETFSYHRMVRENAAKKFMYQLTNHLCEVIQEFPDARICYGCWLPVEPPDMTAKFQLLGCNGDGVYKLHEGVSGIVTIDLNRFKQMLQNGEI